MGSILSFPTFSLKEIVKKKSGGEMFGETAKKQFHPSEKQAKNTAPAVSELRPHRL